MKKWNEKFIWTRLKYHDDNENKKQNINVENHDSISERERKQAKKTQEQCQEKRFDINKKQNQK